MPEAQSFTGGCHCGAVRFAATVTSFDALACNCSICAKKGFIHVIVDAEHFVLKSGEDVLSTYQFNTKVARHLFCQNCGVQSFYKPRSHPNGVSVNLRCLDGDVEPLFEVVPFDGRNWEQHIHEIT